MDEFAELLWPDAVTIGGVRLRAFRYGHAVLLRRIDSPFVAESVEGWPKSGDLAIALEILRHDQPGRLSRLRLRWIAWQLRRVGPRVRDLHARRLAGWLKRQTTGPDTITPTDQDTRQIGAPWLAAIRVQLLRLGYRPAEIWTKSLAEAIWELGAAREQDGSIEIVSREIRELIDMAAAHRQSTSQS